ncbi:MAG: family 1 glycosylhydrolase [Thermoleophilia bacterium]|nr:family 1 glycosylhydrolase [Thermoleophilia bacterium]
MRRAIRRDGVDARGFFQWSLTDNLEWVYGFGPKFGLYSVDSATLERSPRPSARLYGRIARRNALP